MSFFPDSKTFLQIGSMTIQWYALLIMLGAFLAYLWGQYNFKKKGYAWDILSDYFIGVLLTGIIGARLWYVIFMWNDIYASQPLEIIMINHGGLAIQGGLIAGLIYSAYFFKKKNISFLEAGDAIMPGVLVAQALGRWGNFFNQEAHGGVVSHTFLKNLHLPQFIIEGMNIDGVYYHPTFFYESIGCIIGFILIVVVVKHFQKHEGIQFFSYFLWYGVIRYFVEGLRTDSLYVFGLRTAQLVSIAFILIGIVGIIYCVMRGKRLKKI